MENETIDAMFDLCEDDDVLVIEASATLFSKLNSVMFDNAEFSNRSESKL